jgi:hypothetical protein
MPDPKPNETPLEYLRRQARWRVKDAIKFGKLTKGPCEVCGDAKSQAHHTDYTRPLHVRWLCRTHHNDAHRKPRRPQPTPGICWGCGTHMTDWGRYVYCTAECGVEHRNRNANRNALSWGDRCPQTGLLSRNGLDLVRLDAPSGTRTHDLTHQANGENPGHPQETNDLDPGKNSVVPPQCGPKPPRNRNGNRNRPVWVGRPCHGVPSGYCTHQECERQCAFLR